MLTISSVFLGILESCCVLLGLPPCMSGQLVRNLPPASGVLMSTSRAVRSDMRGWIVTDEGDRWSVKLDVRDLGRHLDTTFRGWSATLGRRVSTGHCSVGVNLCSPAGFSW